LSCSARHGTLVAGLLAGSLCLFGAGVGNAAAGTHTAQALEHAQAAAKGSLLEDIPEHAPHVQAAEQAQSTQPQPKRLYMTRSERRTLVVRRKLWRAPKAVSR
jgi:hypothetical protein